MAMRNTGWRYESYRHALAAKGVRTSYRGNYLSWKDSLASAIKDHTESPGDAEMQMAKMRAKDQMRAHLLRRFREDVESGKVREMKEEDLLEKFGWLSKRFIENKGMTSGEYREAVDSMYDDFRKHNSTTLNIFGGED